MILRRLGTGIDLVLRLICVVAGLFLGYLGVAAVISVPAEGFNTSGALGALWPILFAGFLFKAAVSEVPVWRSEGIRSVLTVLFAIVGGLVWWAGSIVLGAEIATNVIGSKSGWVIVPVILITLVGTGWLWMRILDFFGRQR